MQHFNSTFNFFLEYNAKSKVIEFRYCQSGFSAKYFRGSANSILAGAPNMQLSRGRHLYSWNLFILGIENVESSKFCQSGFSAKLLDRREKKTGARILSGFPTVDIDAGLDDKNASVGMCIYTYVS